MGSIAIKNLAKKTMEFGISINQPDTFGPAIYELLQKSRELWVPVSLPVLRFPQAVEEPRDPKVLDGPGCPRCPGCP